MSSARSCRLDHGPGSSGFALTPNGLLVAGGPLPRRVAGQPVPPGHRLVSSCEARRCRRSEEHTSELQSLMRISYAVFCLKKKKNTTKHEANIQYSQTSNNALTNK